MDELESMLDYARSFRGVFYCYGGKNRFEGLDCSGFLCEVLKKAGLLGYHEALSAQGLYEKFCRYAISLACPKLPGDLLFFGPTLHQIEHVSLVIDSYSMIESGGGDHTCTGIEIAKIKGAGVRERVLHLRPDLIALVEPPYLWKA